MSGDVGRQQTRQEPIWLCVWWGNWHRLSGVNSDMVCSLWLVLVRPHREHHDQVWNPVLSGLYHTCVVARAQVQKGLGTTAWEGGAAPGLAETGNWIARPHEGRPRSDLGSSRWQNSVGRQWSFPMLDQGELSSKRSQMVDGCPRKCLHRGWMATMVPIGEWEAITSWILASLCVGSCLWLHTYFLVKECFICFCHGELWDGDKFKKSFFMSNKNSKQE